MVEGERSLEELRGRELKGWRPRSGERECVGVGLREGAEVLVERRRVEEREGIGDKGREGGERGRDTRLERMRRRSLRRGERVRGLRDRLFGKRMDLGWRVLGRLRRWLEGE